MRPKLLFAAPVLLLAVLVLSLVAFRDSDSTVVAATAAADEPVGPATGAQDMRQVEAAVVAVKTWNDAAWYGAVDANAKAAWYTWASRPIPVAKSSSSYTSPSSEPDSTPSIGSGDAEAAVRKYFGDIFKSAWGVSGCESGHDPGAISPGGGNFGLFQINYVHETRFTQVTGQPWSQVLNAEYNAQYARYLYDQSGWGPWACRWAA